jgi:methylmalonyl-CoA mutase cobalamin-binding domain/chain
MLTSKLSMKKIPDSGGGCMGNPSDTDGDMSQVELIKRKVNQFTARKGRRPRILISHVGPGGQKRTLNQMAALFARRGFDVDIGSIAQSPQGVALMAIENDVHMVGLLCDPDRQAQMENDVFESLEAKNSDDILVAFFVDIHTGDSPRKVPGERPGTGEIRASSADVDIIKILDKLS